MNEVMRTIFQRRSIRKYQNKAVEEEKLVLLMQAAMAAPSARNNQPWEFVVITKPEKMAEFRKGMKYGNYNAPAAIVVCSSPKVMQNSDAQKYWIQDCSAAVENILIAAVSLGLGTVWLGVYPKEETIQTVREIVSLPEEITPLAVLYVGYPDEDKEAQTRFEESRVHWQEYP